MSDELKDSPRPPEMPTKTGQPPQMPPQGYPAQAGYHLNPAATPVQDPNFVNQDDRTMGMLVHLLALLTGILGSLILWLVKKDQSRYVDHHGKEALNFQLTMLLYVVVLMVFGLVTMGFGMIIAFPLVMVIGVCGLVFEIMACMAANRGEWHRYPMTIRFIK